MVFGINTTANTFKLSNYITCVISYSIGPNGECRGVTVDQTVVFSVTVTADRCIAAGSR